MRDDRGDVAEGVRALHRGLPRRARPLRGGATRRRGAARRRTRGGGGRRGARGPGDGRRARPTTTKRRRRSRGLRARVREWAREPGQWVRRSIQEGRARAACRKKPTRASRAGRVATSSPRATFSARGAARARPFGSAHAAAPTSHARNMGCACPPPRPPRVLRARDASRARRDGPARAQALADVFLGFAFARLARRAPGDASPRVRATSRRGPRDTRASRTAPSRRDPRSRPRVLASSREDERAPARGDRFRSRRH